MLLAACLVSGSAMAQESWASNTKAAKKAGYQPAAEQTLGTVLRDIERAHDVSFICRSELLDLKINTGKEDFTDKSFAKKLGRLLKAYRLIVKQISSQQFAISNANEEKTSAITEPAESGREAFLPVSSLTVATLQGQHFSTDEIKKQTIAITVTGTVTARDNNNALQGVTVTVKSSSNSVVTNADGKYSITVPDENAVLVFSYIGYLSAERQVKNQQQINVVLEESNKALKKLW